MSPAFIVTGIFIHQAELLNNKNWSKEWFAIAFIVYAISHFKSSLVFGSLVDQYSAQKVFRFYLLPMLLSIILIALPFNSAIIALIFMFLLGFTIGASGPTIGSLWAECYGNKHLGAIRSMVTAIMVISTAVSPILFGYILDSGFSFEQLSLMMIAYLITAWILGLMAKLRPIENK
jgi:MFS family permease